MASIDSTDRPKVGSTVRPSIWLVLMLIVAIKVRGGKMRRVEDVERTR